jgi:hypothetical protein
MITKTISVDDDPRETINWIWYHGRKIDFDSIFLAPEVVLHLTAVEEFSFCEEKEAPAIRLMGHLFEVYVYEDLSCYSGMVELVSHQTGKTKD